MPGACLASDCSLSLGRLLGIRLLPVGRGWASACWSVKWLAGAGGGSADGVCGGVVVAEAVGLAVELDDHGAVQQPVAC